MWNVRSMYKAGKAAIIAKKWGIMVNKYSDYVKHAGRKQDNLNYLCMGELILYSGQTEINAPHTEGVGIMLSKEEQKALISWEPVSYRIITAAQLKTRHQRIKLNIVQVYVPTNKGEYR